MADCEFNLLDEPWIRVMKEDCSVEEVSLTDALIRAHEFRDLAGELPTQNAAVLRLLLAVLHAVFERVDCDGEEAAIESSDGALDRWEELWQLGRFPEAPLREYLSAQRENFWLFHPTNPFWQIPAAENGTEYEASKLNGVLSESSNKLRLFPDRAGSDKSRLTYSEAARWLLYVNAFDDTSAKPTKKGKAENDGKMPSPGAGWLGKMGFVCVFGENLFETLMLNYVLLDDHEEPWNSCVPVWELKKKRARERTLIPVPDDQAALLTLQSRRLILHRENDAVTGFYLLGGDFFEKENAFSEQMTVWGPIKDKKGEITGYQPRRHDRSKQMWRDFALFASVEHSSKIPGVIRWNALLHNEGILSQGSILRFGIASVQYGDKDFFAADVFSDELKVHRNLLSSIGEVYRSLIVDEIGFCDKIANAVGALSSDLFLAAGGDIEKKSTPYGTAKEKYYYEIDVPFRRWLTTLDAEDREEEREEKIKAWRKEAKDAAFRLAEKMAADAGQTAFIGKTVKAEKNKPEKYYSSSIAMQWFRINMKRIWG